MATYGLHVGSPVQDQHQARYKAAREWAQLYLDDSNFPEWVPVAISARGVDDHAIALVLHSVGLAWHNGQIIHR